MLGVVCFKASPPETQNFQRLAENTSRCSINFSKHSLNAPILRLKPTKRKARHPSSTAAAHPVVGKASDSGSERMATQPISTKTKEYRVPQDVCCITTPLGKGDTTLSRCIPLSLIRNMSMSPLSVGKKLLERTQFMLKKEKSLL